MEFTGTGCPVEIDSFVLLVLLITRYGLVQFWSSLKKFTRAYLFQITREKSCDYFLIICMKKLEMVKVAPYSINSMYT